MTKLNIEDIQNEFPNRVSILAYVLNNNASEINKAKDLLHKWTGHYKEVGQSGDEDANIDLNILCTDDAYKDFQDINCLDDWVEKGILVYPYNQKEYEEFNIIDEGTAEKFVPVKLNKQLNLSSTEE